MNRPDTEDLDAIFPNPGSQPDRSDQTPDDVYEEVTVFHGDVLESPEGLSPSQNELVSGSAEMAEKLKTRVTEGPLKSMPSQRDSTVVAVGIPGSVDDPAARVAELAIGLRRKIRHYSTEAGRPLTLRGGIETGTVPDNFKITPHLCYDLTRRSITVARGLSSRANPGDIRVTRSALETIENQSEDQYVFDQQHNIELTPRGKLTTYRLAEANNNPFCSI